MEAKKRAHGHGSSRETPDHYRLLQVDPDASQYLIHEAYWHAVGKMLCEDGAIEEVAWNVASLNAAYAVLAHPERRHAYDATLARVSELRLRRAAREEKSKKKRPPAADAELPAVPQRNYYEMLGVDPAADPGLIERACLILRILHLNGKTDEDPEERLAELATALETLLDDKSRTAYDQSLKEIAAAEPQAADEATVGAPEPPGQPTWPARATSALSSAVAAVAQGWRSAIAFPSGNRQGDERTWRRERARKAATQLPDDRLLRDVTPVAATERTPTLDGPRRGRLIVCSPGRREEIVNLDKDPVILGSGRDCDVRLAAEPGQAAPAHAQIWFTGERFVIRSLDPLHPTIVCGHRVNWASLEDGDEIEIGRYRLRFETVDDWKDPPDFLMREHTEAAAEEVPERRD